MPFTNRSDAGRQLAAALGRYRTENPVILALPRGGVPVAAEIAAALQAPLDLILVRKIGLPLQPELAMGAIADGAAPQVVRNEDVIRLAGIEEATFTAAGRRELAEIERRRRLYLQGRPRVNIAGHTAIVVDDGIATGATVRVALQAARHGHPSRLVLAVPVASADALEVLRDYADDIVCLEASQHFRAVGYCYGDFGQITDQEVIDLLARFPGRQAGPADVSAA